MVYLKVFDGSRVGGWEEQEFPSWTYGLKESPVDENILAN
jgi:hypothetical protein